MLPSLRRQSSSHPPPAHAPDAFSRARSPDWQTLEALLTRFETHGPAALSLREARALGKLYRAACADLLVAQAQLKEAALADYLNVLVARGYAAVYASETRFSFDLVGLFLRVFPALVRRERRLVALSALIFLLGGVFGALVIRSDPSALGLVIPEMHQLRTPSERVRDEATAGDGHDAGAAAVFSSFLLTHNIQVTFLVFALGITLGIGTACVLFFNGVPLGALAAQYHASGQGLFFWAWILPHGVVELTVVVIAGAAGFVLARGLWKPGLQTRGAAVVREGQSAVRLVIGGMPMLVVAGIVEGTISQMHEPAMPYSVKLTVAGGLFVATCLYLSRGGIERSRKRLSSIKIA